MAYLGFERSIRSLASLKRSSVGGPKLKASLLLAVVMFAFVPLLSLVGEAPAARADALSLDANMTLTWERTDLPIVQGKLSRSWLWGPQASHIMTEDYADAPGGKRLVAYYDKSRMEINNPSGDRSSKWFVTNGLLVKELISGQRQDGDTKFTALLPSNTPVAGDPGNDGPTYASFYNIATIDPTQNRATNQTGQNVTTTLAKDGTVGQDLTLSNYNVKYANYDGTLGHNIPKPFWDFMNSTGLVYQNGNYVNGPVVDWTFSTGYPLAEAYWAKVQVAGKKVDVLMQPFQRRVLTYTPSNPAGYQVEMGNVGQHYYSWRYENPLPDCSLAPVSGFGKVWGNNYSVKARLGCANSPEEGLNVTYEPFQGGTMFQIDLNSLSHYYYPLRNYTNNGKIVLVLFNDDHSWAAVNDGWTAGQPANGGLTPPAGLYEPQNSIGKVWREGTALHIRDRLGWATAPSQTTNAALENFYNGNMFYAGANKTIYVLYSYYSKPSVWESYADTNSGTGQ